MSVFQKLGLERVVRAFSELVPTRENSFQLVPTLIFAKNHVFSRFSFLRVSVIAFRLVCLVLTREDSFRLETRLEISDKILECRALLLVYCFSLLKLSSEILSHISVKNYLKGPLGRGTVKVPPDLV